MAEKRANIKNKHQLRTLEKLKNNSSNQAITSRTKMGMASWHIHNTRGQLEHPIRPTEIKKRPQQTKRHHQQMGRGHKTGLPTRMPGERKLVTRTTSLPTLLRSQERTETFDGKTQAPPRHTNLNWHQLRHP